MSSKNILFNKIQFVKIVIWRCLELNVFSGLELWNSDMHKDLLPDFSCFQTRETVLVSISIIYVVAKQDKRDIYVGLQSGKSEGRSSPSLDLNPPKILSDFELTINKQYNSVSLLQFFQGCYFNYCQVLCRKIQQVGLQARSRENTGFKRFVHKTLLCHLYRFNFLD